MHFKAPSMIDFVLEVFNWRQQCSYASYFFMLYLFLLQYFISAFESPIYEQCCALKTFSKGRKFFMLYAWSCYSIFFFVKWHLWLYQEFCAIRYLSITYHFMRSSGNMQIWVVLWNRLASISWFAFSNKCSGRYWRMFSIRI